MGSQRRYLHRNTKHLSNILTYKMFRPRFHCFNGLFYSIKNYVLFILDFGFYTYWRIVNKSLMSTLFLLVVTKATNSFIISVYSSHYRKIWGGVSDSACCCLVRWSLSHRTKTSRSLLPIVESIIESIVESVIPDCLLFLMYILLEEISSIQVNQFNQSHIHFYDISTCLYRHPDSHLTQGY